jgi:hypothetical protein
VLARHSSVCVSRELFDVTLRLLVNLTSPELLLFKEELPEDKETRNYYLQIQVSELATYKNTLTVFVPLLVWPWVVQYVFLLLRPVALKK